MGHVFKGEGLTKKNVRHCVNSVSLQFDKKKAVTSNLEKAYFAGGCFWGVEYYLEKIKGVKEVTSGFMGGNMRNPSYKDVIYKNTGHLETVEVVYDPAKVSYETLAKTFFEIHDPTQTNGQGPDIGSHMPLITIFSKNTIFPTLVTPCICRANLSTCKICFFNLLIKKTGGVAPCKE